MKWARLGWALDLDLNDAVSTPLTLKFLQTPHFRSQFRCTEKSKELCFQERERNPDPESDPKTRKNREKGKGGLSDDQVSSMKEAFMLFDTDGDGKIAPAELGILMRSLGGNPTQAQLKSITASENLSSPFDFNRFLDLMAKHLKTEPFDRQLRDAFKVLDKEGTGFVAVADLRHILTSIGEKLEPNEFDEWIKEVDVGSDGKIRYEDFIARMVAK